MPDTKLFVNKTPGGIFVVKDKSFIAGDLFIVDSGVTAAADTAGFGKTFTAPFATIDFAIGQCTANNGDVIMVMPGHTETVIAASGIDFDVAGIYLLGIGTGVDRPTITFTTDAGASVVVDAKSTKIENVLFVNGIAAQTNVVDVNESDCKIINCELRHGASTEYLVGIDFNGGTANDTDRCLVKDCYFTSPADGGNTAIELGEISDGILIEGNRIWGDFDDACIHNITGKVLTNLTIKDNVLVNLASGQHAIELVSACTGVIANNVGHSTLAAAGGLTAIDQGSCFCLENYFVDATANVSGLINPIIDAS